MRRLILWSPVLLPFYVFRLKIGPLPTTVLELAFFALVIGATFKDRALWTAGWRATRDWRLAASAWILATLIAVFVAPDHIAALGLWRAYVLEPIVYFILLCGALKTGQDRQRVIRAFITAATMCCAWAVFQFVTNIGIPSPWGTADWMTRRATGPFPFPNALALFCAPIAALCIGMLLSDRKGEVKPRPYTNWLIVGLASSIIATLLAKSAGGTIAILAVAFIALVMDKRTRIKTLVTSAIALAVLFGVPQIRTPLVKLLSFKDWSGQVRLIIWKETAAMLKDHPVFGAGFGAYPEVIRPYHKATFIEIFQYPHDILLNLWSETGLLGILAFGWICWAWVRRAWADTGVRPYIFPLLAILIHGLVDVPYFKNDLAMAFWTFAALTIAVQKDNLAPRN